MQTERLGCALKDVPQCAPPYAGRGNDETEVDVIVTLVEIWTKEHNARLERWGIQQAEDALAVREVRGRPQERGGENRSPTAQEDDPEAGGTGGGGEQEQADTWHPAPSPIPIYAAEIETRRVHRAVVLPVRWLP